MASYTRLHFRYPSTTRLYIGYSSDYVSISKYGKDRYNCLNLFLKVQSDELRKSPDTPLQVSILGSEQRVEKVRLLIMVFSGHHYFQVGFDA